LITCSIGKCPIDGKNPICCVHCEKNSACESACKIINKACTLQQIKKRLLCKATLV